MMPSAQEAVNIVERLEASDGEFNETLMEIIERRDTTELGELRRRLFIAERAGCGKLADMWRRQIGNLDQKDFEAHVNGDSNE